MMEPDSVQERYLKVREEIDSIARKAGHKPEDVILLTVTKGHSVKETIEVIEAGAMYLGESYPDVALQKIQQIKQNYVVEWHMIGHIQSRKSRLVVDEYALIHSLDSLKLARKLDRLAAENNKPLDVLLEINISGEGSKYGWHAHQKDHWPALMTEFAEVIKLENLHLRGLMTMAPYGTDPDEARPVFAGLRNFRDALAEQFPEQNLEHLSMGMSGDYQPAIEEGATIVRVGTAIMGSRNN